MLPFCQMHNFTCHFRVWTSAKWIILKSDLRRVSLHPNLSGQTKKNKKCCKYFDLQISKQSADKSSLLTPFLCLLLWLTLSQQALSSISSLAWKQKSLLNQCKCSLCQSLHPGDLMISPGGQHKHINSSMEQWGQRSARTSPHIEVVFFSSFFQSHAPWEWRWKKKNGRPT